MSSTCVQAGMARPLGGFQQHLIQNASPEAAWHFSPSVIPKQEPVEEERNDSGINSDCPSSSPGSDRVENPHLSSPPAHQPMSDSAYTSTPTTQIPYDTWYKNNFINGPMENKDVQPKLEQNSAMSAPSPKRKDSTDSRSTNEICQDYQPSPSPRQDSSGDEATGEFDDQGIRVPKVNSHGKIKVHKCKQCDFVAYTKLDFWNHSANHIKGDKALKCTKCPFVTEYKHHLEYHLLNHAGAKPFKCDHCDYSCVNKSMLNSHLKSHSKVYQYRCANCLYETKYCHSLKLHLRKYNHKPAMVLNPDGTPNPLPIIDVYGTRRGPKLKKQSSNQAEAPSTPTMPGQPPIMPPFNPLAHFMVNPPPQMPFPFPLAPNSDIVRILQERLQDLAKQSQVAAMSEAAVLDLSKNGHSSDEEDDTTTTMFNNVEVVEDKSSSADNTLTDVREDSRDMSDSSNNNEKMFSCQYCSISFGEEVLYRIHMGYHGYSNPFTCNMCGEECRDKVSFFLHIARAAH